MGVTDEERLSSALTGDREALGALLEAHGPGVRERLGCRLRKADDECPGLRVEAGRILIRYNQHHMDGFFRIQPAYVYA